MYSKSCKKFNIFLHSPAEPFEKYKNRTNSFLVSLSKPSAILFEIDNAALCNWSFKPKSFAICGFVFVYLQTLTPKRNAF